MHCYKVVWFLHFGNMKNNIGIVLSLFHFLGFENNGNGNRVTILKIMEMLLDGSLIYFLP